MESWEFVGYKLLNDTTITAEVGQRIFHGVRPPNNAALPCINFFQVTPGNYAFYDTGGIIHNPKFQISCRANTAQKAMEISRLVGISFMNYKGVANSFDVPLCKQLPSGGLLFEEEGEVFLVPVEIQFVFQDNTVS